MTSQTGEKQIKFLYPEHETAISQPNKIFKSPEEVWTNIKRQTQAISSLTTDTLYLGYIFVVVLGLWFLALVVFLGRLASIRKEFSLLTIIIMIVCAGFIVFGLCTMAAHGYHLAMIYRYKRTPVHFKIYTTLATQSAPILGTVVNVKYENHEQLIVYECYGENNESIQADYLTQSTVLIQQGDRIYTLHSFYGNSFISVIL